MNRTHVLLRPLSSEWAFSQGSTCADLPGTFRDASLNDPSFLNSPYLGFIGPSCIPGAGLGCFLQCTDLSLREGTDVGTYWGPDTNNGGIDPSFLGSTEDPPGRDDGAYLLVDTDEYIVDAHVHCAVGYLNDPFEEANCFFQPDPDNPLRIILVNRVHFPRHGIYELTVNYGWDYWKDRLRLLSSEARRRCIAFYRPEDGRLSRTS